jgi:hypothetical protein
MNPYLEQNDTWEDFHQELITRAREVLEAQVGPNYLVKIEVRLYLHELDDDERRFMGRADVGIAPKDDERSGGTVATARAPMQLVLPAVEVGRYSSLEIRDRRDRRLVTAIELLSPANKNNKLDRAAYLSKRQGYWASLTNFVEIDLRRGGERPSPPDLPSCDYYVIVSRIQDRPLVDFWPIHLRDRLPNLPIPLTADDLDIYVDLQDLLHRTYDAAGYAKYIYRETPQPPLVPADAQWARQFLPANGA